MFRKTIAILEGISDGTKVVPDLSSTMIARSNVLLVLFFWYQKISLQYNLADQCYQISLDQNPKPFFQTPATRRPSFTITTWYRNIYQYHQRLLAAGYISITVDRYGSRQYLVHILDSTYKCRL